MTRGEKAKENFLHGLNCAQSVVMAFADLLEVPEQTLMALALPMGAGMGRLRGTCGAVTGAVLTAGLLFPQTDKNGMYALVQEIARRFTARNGSINCGVLLTGAGLKAETSPQAEERTEEYYRKRPCPMLASDAAEILEEILQERACE